MQAPQRAGNGTSLPRLNTAVSGQTHHLLPTPPVSASPPQHRSSVPLAQYHSPPIQPNPSNPYPQTHMRPSSSGNSRFPGSPTQYDHGPPGTHQAQATSGSRAYPVPSHNPYPSPQQLPLQQLPVQQLSPQHYPSAMTHRAAMYAHHHPASGINGGPAPHPNYPNNMPPQQGLGLVHQRPTRSMTPREILEQHVGAQSRPPPSPVAPYDGHMVHSLPQRRQSAASSTPHSPELPRQPTNSAALSESSSPVYPHPPAPPATPPKQSPRTPLEPAPQQPEQPRPQQEPPSERWRTNPGISNWDAVGHAHATMNTIENDFALLMRNAELKLMSELGEVKKCALRNEQDLARVTSERHALKTECDTLKKGKAVSLAAAQAEREAANAARAAEAEARANMMKAGAAVTQLSAACSELQNKLRMAQTEVQELRAQRERMREENWQLKEVVAKLSRDVHLGERERRESNVPDSRDNLLQNVLAQAKEEQENRIRVERELTELKAKVSKAALLHSTVTSDTWRNVSEALPKLDDLCTPFMISRPDRQRDTSGLQSSGQTPVPSWPEASSTGLATPKSQMGTVDAEPAPSKRVPSEVVDSVMPTVRVDKTLKRSASPSFLDNEESALKRRRTRKPMYGSMRSSSAEHIPPEPRPQPQPLQHPPAAVDEFGAAPLLTVNPSAASGAAHSDETLVDFVESTTPDVTMDDKKTDESEDGEILLADPEPALKPPAAAGRPPEPSQRHMPPPPDRPPKEEEEDGEIKLEVPSSPELIEISPPSTPSLFRSNTHATPTSAMPSRNPSVGTSFHRPLPASRSSAGAHDALSKPAVPAPCPRPPPPRRALTISHINLAYEQVGKRYVCVMCKFRHAKDATFRVASFFVESSWDILAGHIEREHPMGFDRLVNMSSGEIAEAVSRK